MICPWECCHAKGKEPPVIRRLLPRLLFLLFFVPIQGRSQVVVVLSEDQDSNTEAMAGIRDVVPAASTVHLKDGLNGITAGDVVVALGDEAAHADYPAGVPLVVALVLDPDQKISRPCVRVSPLPDGFVLMGKIHDLVPTLSTLAVFNVKDHDRDYIKYLGAAGAISTVKVSARSIGSLPDLVSGLRAIHGRAEALWLTPESSLLRQDSFKVISDFCMANKIALIAPVAILAKVGALAGVAPSFRDQGREAGKAALALQSGKPGPLTVSSSKCETLINGGVATALGLKPSASDGEIIP
jgi:hypothetical protein